MVVPVLLAEGMPTIVGAEMEEVQAARDPVVHLASPGPLGWGTGAPTALVAVEVVLEEQEARRSPWKTSSRSMPPTPLQDLCTLVTTRSL